MTSYYDDSQRRATRLHAMVQPLVALIRGLDTILNR